MLKSMFLLAIFAITISFGLQYADATSHCHNPGPASSLYLHEGGDETVTLLWGLPENNGGL